MRRNTPEVQDKEGCTAGLELNNFPPLRKETCLEAGNPASQGSKVPQLVG